jgi:ABC-type Fe3+ transport system permease subunit
MTNAVSIRVPDARRALTVAIIAAGQLVLLASLAAPLVVALIDAIAVAIRSDAARAIDSDLLGVLPRTIGIAACAGALATALAIPASILLGSTGRRAWPRAGAIALVLLPLLTPSHVHVYLWQLLRTAFVEPGSLGPIGRVVNGWFGVAWVTACWLWPIPAMLLAAGWRREAAAVLEVALLDLPAWRARLTAARAVLLPYAAAGLAIVFVMSSVEYTVPHLAIVSTYAGAVPDGRAGAGVAGGPRVAGVAAHGSGSRPGHGCVLVVGADAPRGDRRRSA